MTKRASTNNVKATGAGDQRLQAACKRAVAAHTNVKRMANRLKQEFETLTPSNGIVVTDLDPEDSMVVAVEKVITTSASQTIPPPIVSRVRTNITNIGLAPMPKADPSPLPKKR